MDVLVLDEMLQALDENIVCRPPAPVRADVDLTRRGRVVVVL